MEAPYVACSVAVAGAGIDSTIGVVTDSILTGSVSGVGIDESTERFALDGEETFRFDVGEMAELGVTPVLIERISGGFLGAGVLGAAGAETSLSGCQTSVRAPVALLGMATSEGEQSTIVLANPFAVEATARLTGSSEFGLDTVAEVETVRVPSNSTLTLPLGQLMAGRQQLGFTLYTEAGALVAGMTRSGPDIAASEALSGALQWFVPAPGFGLPGHLIIRSLAPVEATYRVDAITGNGLIEGVDNGALLPDTELWLEYEALGPSGGFVVTADESVAVAVEYAGESTRIVSTASPSTTVTWLIPISSVGAGLETAVWVLNPGENPATAVVRVFGGATTEVELPPGSTTGQLLAFSGRGGIVTATEPVAVFYGVVSEGGSASMTLGLPLE
jgi:hypothetical protein